MPKDKLGFVGIINTLEYARGKIGVGTITARSSSMARYRRTSSSSHGPARPPSRRDGRHSVQKLVMESIRFVSDHRP